MCYMPAVICSSFGGFVCTSALHDIWTAKCQLHMSAMLQHTPACCHQASCGCAPFYHVAAAAPAVLAVLPAAAGDAAGAADVVAAVSWPFAVQPAAAAGRAASPARRLSKWCSGTSGDASAALVTLHTCAQMTQLLEMKKFLPVQPPLCLSVSSRATAESNLTTRRQLQ